MLKLCEILMEYILCFFMHDRRHGHEGINLFDLSRGSALVMESPAQRTRSPELIARNVKLQEQWENKQ